MKIYNEIAQGSEDWLKLRAGKFTASVFADLFMGKSTLGYQEAINRVVFERVTGTTPESYSNEYMNRGTELEPSAREAYQLETFNYVKEVGFIELDQWVGCSPDGLVGDNGLIEIKVPKWSTLMSYMFGDTIPKGYTIQMQGQMFVSGRQWCDFYAWHPNLKPFLKRVERDEKMIAEISGKLQEAITEAKNRITQIQGVV